MSCQKTGLWKIKLFYVFKTWKIILSVVCNEIRNTIFYIITWYIWKWTKNNTFNNVFCNRIFPCYRFLPIIWKLLDLHKSCFIFWRKICSKILLFPILKVKNKIFKYSYLYKFPPFKNSFINFSHWKLYFKNWKQ